MTLPIGPLSLFRPLSSIPFSILIALIPALFAFGLSACDARDQVDVSSAPPPVIVSGRYDVKGVTRASGAPDGRRIEGTVILLRSGDTYTATYELETLWPAEGAETVADVVGVGEGRVSGGRLEGGAQTQLVISTVPGVDPGFAFVPRAVTTRIESTSVATVRPDGSIEIELENHAAEGEEYEPTRTRLVGRRVPGGASQPVASTP